MADFKKPSRRKIMFYSSNTSWGGGSEVLWYNSAIVLSKDFDVVYLADYGMRQLSYVKALQKQCIRVLFFNRFKKTTILNRFRNQKRDIERIMDRENPSLVVMSLGTHFLTGHLPSICKAAGVPYVLLFQLVNDNKWIEHEQEWLQYRESLKQALCCYFVSDSNKRTIEKMISCDLDNARRINNPFQVDFTAPFLFPQTASGLRLANVGRYAIGHKGQDVLLEVLNQEKWKSRALTVDLVGQGNCKIILEELIRYYGLKNVHVVGHMDPEQIWAHYHGLVLTSRREGSSLALMEALVKGRVPICTAVGSAEELISDNENGFLAKYCYPEFVDDALERAWDKRDRWQQIGRRNYELSRETFKRNPIEDFCEELTAIVEGQRG